MKRFLAAACLAAAALSTVEAGPRPGAAANSGESERVKRLEAQVAELQSQVRQLMKLQQQPAVPVATQVPAPAPAEVARPAGSAGRVRLIDLSVSLLNDLSNSTASAGDFLSLQGGDHDPRGKGFSAPNEEFVLSGVVDPYFRGDLIFVAKLNEAGETEIEMEEASLTTTSLGDGLEAKGGLFLTDFGRLNTYHPHSWDFVNQPVIFSRVMSPEGMRGAGARLAWLLPADDYYRLYVSAQSPVGGPMHSFRGDGALADPTDVAHQIGGYGFTDQQLQGPADMVYTARLETSRDLSDEFTIVPGVSFSTGPNATGPESRTRIFGFDLYGKWKPLNNDHGFPFWAFQAEVLKRSYQAAAGPLFSDATVGLPAATLDDWGFYAQVVHGFKRNWTAGLRLDYANGDGANGQDPLRDRRWRVSPALTHYFSEFSKLRYQYDYDVAEHLGDDPEHTFTIQYEVNFGAHGAHKF